MPVNSLLWPLRVESRRDREDLEFLPAALEIVEAPASPAGRALVYTILALFCIVLAWISLGSVDIVASATGKVIPSDGAKVVQPFETGDRKSVV